MFKYIKLGKILKDVIERRKQLKSILYNSNQIKPTQIPMAYSLLSLIVNNFNAIKEAQQQICQKIKTNATNPYLMYIMIAEFINTGKIVGGGQLKKIIIEHQHLIPKIQKQSKINKQTIQIRLRVNDANFSAIEQKISQIGQKDKLIPNMYHLSQQSYSDLTRNSNLDILNSSACVMQSFSSSLPPFLLLKGVEGKWKQRKYDVIDACSAPGNKTVQLAEYNQQGKIFAFQKNERRFQLLKTTISKYNCKNIISKNQDFLQLINKKALRRVKFILLDPSCSGSGMLTNFTRDGSKTSDISEPFQQFCERQYKELNDKQKKRIQNLHNFQSELLNHAATFQPLRLSYSTCSIYRRQNEDVVEKFLQDHPEYMIKQYRISKMHPLLTNGFGELCKNCIRVDPRKMQTDGFFVTIFSRIKVKSND